MLARGARGLPRATACIVAAAAIGLLAGCGSSSGDSSGSPARAAETIERNERNEEAAALQKEEAAETAKNRELLSQIEAKTSEEAAEAKAKATEHAAAVKAKKREAEAKKKQHALEEQLKKEQQAHKQAATKPKLYPSGAPLSDSLVRGEVTIAPLVYSIIFHLAWYPPLARWCRAVAASPIRRPSGERPQRRFAPRSRSSG